MKIDPDCPTLAPIVIEGRRARHTLLHIRDNEHEFTIPENYKNQFHSLTYPEFDSIHKMFVRSEDMTFEAFVTSMFDKYQDGLVAEKKIIKFRDYIFTNFNRNEPIPLDANVDERTPPVQHDRSHVTPMLQ